MTTSLNSNLTANSNPFKFGYEDGKYGYYLPDGEGGADTLHPFSSNPKSAYFYWDFYSNNNAAYTIDVSGIKTLYYSINNANTDDAAPNWIRDENGNDIPYVTDGSSSSAYKVYENTIYDYLNGDNALPHAMDVSNINQVTIAGGVWHYFGKLYAFFSTIEKVDKIKM